MRLIYLTNSLAFKIVFSVLNIIIIFYFRWISKMFHMMTLSHQWPLLLLPDSTWTWSENDLKFNFPILSMNWNLWNKHAQSEESVWSVFKWMVIFCPRPLAYAIQNIVNSNRFPQFNLCFCSCFWCVILCPMLM